MDKSTAVEAIRRLAVQYQAMVEAADVLEQIGSLEQHEAEVRARLAIALDNEADTLQRLHAIEQVARDAADEQAAIWAQTGRDTQAELEAAAEQAKEVVEAARKQAKDLLEGAAAVNEEQVRVFAIRESDAEHRLEELARHEAHALARKAAAENDADAAQAKLDAIRDSIAKIAKA